MTAGELMDRMDAQELEEWIAEYTLRSEEAKQTELNRRVNRKRGRHGH